MPEYTAALHPSGRWVVYEMTTTPHGKKSRKTLEVPGSENTSEAARAYAMSLRSRE